MMKMSLMPKEDKREMTIDQLFLMPLDFFNLNLEPSGNMFLEEQMKLRKLSESGSRTIYE